MGEEVTYPLINYSIGFPKNPCWKPILVEKAEELYCEGCKECENLIEEAKEKGLKKILIESETGHLRINF